jgi:predicted ATPase
MRAEGSQVVVATHSPLVASLPGATLLELGDWGIRPVDATSATSSRTDRPTARPSTGA